MHSQLNYFVAFLAVGKISLAVGSAIGPYLDPIIITIRDALTATKPRAKGAAFVDESIFQCISMLAMAVGQVLTKYMHDLLEPMMATGLSEPLRQALVDLARCVPPLLNIIQGSISDIAT